MQVMPGRASKHSSSRGLLAVRGPWSPEAARDRLSSTLFLAALIHGILILGVTFTADAPRREPAAATLDVVIVTRDYEKLAPPRNPALLARQNLVGRGNAPVGARLRTALPQSEDTAAPGPDQAGLPIDAAKAGIAAPAEPRLTAATRDRPTVLPAETGAAVPAAQRQTLVGNADTTELLADPDLVTVIPDANPRELVVSANTRESRIAGYLNTWKTKVERIGTLNIPGADELARTRSYPVLQVAITADGGLKEAVVRNSSGYRSLDQAALEILRIAAPFEPFPQALRNSYDVLRFEYEWHFINGGAGRGRIVTVSGG
jgi:protein TonB